ncbi:MAG: cytochrome c [Vulcanimicrobiaceae bacterium]
MHSKPFALLAVGALAALVALGCSKGSDQSSSSGSPAPGATTAAAGSAAPVALGDVAAGKQIFTANCSTCHGATGREGGIGPSLTNEKSRKNFDQTVAWIHNPTPPMPKLWPSPLNDKNVADVAAYVQSL